MIKYQYALYDNKSMIPIKEETPRELFFLGSDDYNKRPVESFYNKVLNCKEKYIVNGMVKVEETKFQGHVPFEKIKPFDIFIGHCPKVE